MIANRTIFVVFLILMLTAACAAPASPDHGATTEIDHEEQQHDEGLPHLGPVALDADERLQVVVSTNIVADVVAKVGGETIDLTALMSPGVDPHGFEPTPQDRILLENAHVVFINGLGLEESLMSMLESPDGGATTVSVNTGVALLDFGHSEDHEEHADEDHADEDHADEDHGDEDHGDEDHGDEEHGDEEHDHAHDGDDPHTWFSVYVVEQWVENIALVLSELDPDSAETYAANAQAYRTELEALEEEIDALIAELLPEQRKMVTDHDSFGYFADEYGFEVIGTVMPSISTMAAPSAAQLAQLHDQIEEEAVKAIFVGTTVNADVAQAIADDTGVQIVTLYTGSLSEVGGPADNYLDFMRYNVGAIVEALK